MEVLIVELAVVLLDVEDICFHVFRVVIWDERWYLFVGLFIGVIRLIIYGCL